MTGSNLKRRRVHPGLHFERQSTMKKAWWHVALSDRHAGGMLCFTFWWNRKYRGRSLAELSRLVALP